LLDNYNNIFIRRKQIGNALERNSRSVVKKRMLLKAVSFFRGILVSGKMNSRRSEENWIFRRRRIGSA